MSDDRKQTTADVFDRAAEMYDQLGVDFFTPMGRDLVGRAGLRPGERVLDLGAGRGAVTSTGLIRAVERGHHDIVGRLLQTDIDVDHVNNLGWVALHEAIVLADGSESYVGTGGPGAGGADSTSRRVMVTAPPAPTRARAWSRRA